MINERVKTGRPSPIPIRVLLAEDDDDIREALVDVLELEGCEVCAVSDGSALLDHLGGWVLTEKPGTPADLIITDVRMPGFCGLDIVSGLRAYGWPLPVIVISAFGDDEMRRAVGQTRSAVFMEKPLDMQRLKSTILRLVGREPIDADAIGRDNPVVVHAPRSAP